jgi:uncharacterized membrane protein YkvA (DUF1232 family)
MIESLKKALCAIADDLKKELVFYRLLLANPRTPWTAKALMGAAVGYALSPIDLIPDFIPVIGYLDDLVIVPGLLWAAMKLIPRDVIEECRRAVETPPGTDRPVP